MKRGKPVAFAFILMMFMSAPLWPQAAPEPAQAANGSGSRSPAENPGTIEVETGATYEDLTHDFAAWRQAYLLIVKRIAQRKAVYGTIEETSRYSRNDTQFTGGAYYPLGEQWTVLVEGSVSPTHDALAKWSALGQVEHAFGSGWEAHAGLRHRQYSAATVEIGNLTIQKSIETFRVAYTLYPSHLEAAGFATTHRAEINHYYGDSAVNLSLAYGSELENIVPAGVLRTHVKMITLGGTHWFAPAWAVSYSGSWYEQGRFYTRRGLTLGLRRRL